MSNKTDLHVFHFRSLLPLGGDLDAAFTPRQIVDWVERFKIFDRFVLGNHPPYFFRISTKLSPEEYFDALSSLVEALRPKFSGPSSAKATVGKRLFKGIECDVLIEKGGKIGFNPSEKLLAHYNPEVSLLSFHFHKSLIYTNRFDIPIVELVLAFKAAINSGVFQILAHPFDALGQIYKEDRRSFEEIANLAREKKVAFEINADKGFGEETISALIKNDNLFSFGGDFHGFSYWLKRDKVGLEVKEEDKVAMERLLGLTAEVAEREKRYWRELDPLVWQLPYPSEEKHALRNYAVRLYRHCYPKEETFEEGIKGIVEKFDPAKKEIVGKYLRDLHQIYTKWGGAPRKDLRMRLEKYFLKAPLTKNEISVYEHWLVKACELGLKKERFINSWDSARLEKFLRR